MLETLKTINVDLVPEAFAKAGIKPEIGIMDRCVMSAVCYPEIHFEDFVREGFDKEYLYGVMDGWDWGDNMLHSTWNSYLDIHTSIKYKLGRAHGTAARKIMNPLAKPLLTILANITF